MIYARIDRTEQRTEYIDIEKNENWNQRDRKQTIREPIVDNRKK